MQNFPLSSRVDLSEPLAPLPEVIKISDDESASRHDRQGHSSSQAPHQSAPTKPSTSTAGSSHLPPASFPLNSAFPDNNTRDGVTNRTLNVIQFLKKTLQSGEPLVLTNCLKPP